MSVDEHITLGQQTQIRFFTLVDLLMCAGNKDLTM